MVEKLKSNIKKLKYFMYTMITMNIVGGLTCQKKVANHPKEEKTFIFGS